MQRAKITYTPQEEQVMRNNKQIILLEIENKQILGKSEIYDNQEECALRAVSSLHDRKILNLMILALTQSGKTGTMIALIKNFLNDTSNVIPIENIYIITGLSSIEWSEQTKGRMPLSMQERVSHGGKLGQQFIDEIRVKRNILIIIDEVHIAAKEKQTLQRTFNRAGFYDKQRLLEDDVKIIEFTATPDGTIYDLMNWNDSAAKIRMKPGTGYTSCFDLIDQGRVFQYKDLCPEDNKEAIDNINEIKERIDQFDRPLYHIIRTPKGHRARDVIHNFETVFSGMIYQTYDNESDIDDINRVLSEESVVLKPLLIFILPMSQRADIGPIHYLV
eukprot:764440-Hanusia_phi.AAC.2